MSTVVFHGYRQGGMITKKIFPYADCPTGDVYVEDVDAEARWGWFPLVRSRLLDGSYPRELFEEHVTWRPEKDKEYTTVIGFSQGCLVAMYLVSLGILNPDRLILIAPSPVPSWMPKIDTPTLVLLGERDTLVPHELSRKILPYLSKCEVQVHRWGHVIPTTSVYKRIYREWTLE